MSAPALPPFATRVAPVLDNLRYASESRFSWGPEGMDLDPSRIAFFEARPGYPTLVAQAGQLLYEAFYGAGEFPSGSPRSRSHEHGVRRGASHATRTGTLLDTEFTNMLDAANRTPHSWQHGWTLAKDEGGEEILVQRGKEPPIRVPRASFDPAGRVKLDHGSARIQPGWYHARGLTDHAGDGPDTTRVYWSVTRLGAGPLMRALTTGMNDAGLPFRFKTLGSAGAYARADAAVLYAPRAEWDRIRDVVEATHEKVVRHLHPNTPALTKPLAYGVSVADNPPGGESFGMSRCRLLAEALWDAHVAGVETDEGRLEKARARFLAEGVDPEAPHLNPGNRDIYAFRPRAAGPPRLEAIL